MTLLWQTKDHKSEVLNTASRRQKSKSQHISSHVFPTFSWKHQYPECTSKTCCSPGLTCPSIRDRKGEGDSASPSNPQLPQCSWGAGPAVCQFTCPLTPPQQGRGTTQAGKIAAKAACVPQEHWQTLPVPKLSSLRVVNTLGWQTGSTKGEKQVLVATEQADMRSTHGYSAVHCSLDSGLLPFLSAQFALESVQQDKHWPTASWVVKVDGKRRSDYLPWGN